MLGVASGALIHLTTLLRSPLFARKIVSCYHEENASEYLKCMVQENAPRVEPHHALTLLYLLSGRHCSDQFLPKVGKFLASMKPIKLHNDEQAKSEVEHLILAINTNLAQMKDTIEKYGDTIASKWQNRKSNKREALLRKVKPDLHSQQGAETGFVFELQAANERPKGHPLPETVLHQYQETALNPYLNVATLREYPLKLLALMHYRATTAPSDWILFDCRQVKSSFQLCYLETAYKPHCVVAFGPDFGKLVQREKDASHKWDTIGYTAARLALKALLNLTGFLCNMMESLLEADLSQATKGHMAWDRLAKQGFRKADAEGTVWAYADSAYSAAPKPDFKRIVELFTTQ